MNGKIKGSISFNFNLPSKSHHLLGFSFFTQPYEIVLNDPTVVTYDNRIKKSLKQEASLLDGSSWLIVHLIDVAC